MSREMTNSEAISNLNHIYGMVSPNIQRSLDVAIKALEERPQGEISNDYLIGYMEGCKDTRNKFDNIPTLEERPQDEWIDHSDEGYVECPFCHEATNCEDNKEELHFCWNCGAKLI